MSGYQRFAQAYKSASNLRPQREQDAEVFEVIAARLREAERQDTLARIKALADNRRLWQTVSDVTVDDNNPQPVHVRKPLLALAKTVLAEMSKPAPDIRSLVEINGNVAAGLRGSPPGGAPPSGG